MSLLTVVADMNSTLPKLSVSLVGFGHFGACEMRLQSRMPEPIPIINGPKGSKGIPWLCIF